MKTKLIALAAFAMFNFQLSTVNSAKAQRPSNEEMQARRTEMTEKRAEKLAKDFDLKGGKKNTFVNLYKNYQQELQAARQQERNRPQQSTEKDNDKKLSDEQAQKMLEQYFERQEGQIKSQQERLQIERKYCAEFKSILTPQQLAKVFVQQRNQQRQGYRNQGGFGPRGGQGGPRGGQRQGGFGGGDGGFGGDF